MVTTLLVDRVRTTLEHLGANSTLEEVMELCPELTWNQVFLAIDHLSRTGKIQVTLDANRTYRVRTALSEYPPASGCDRETVKQEPRGRQPV